MYIYIYTIQVKLVTLVKGNPKALFSMATIPRCSRRSIPGRVIPKIQKMVLDSALLNTQHYTVRIQGKVEQSREWSSALSPTSVW